MTDTALAPAVDIEVPDRSAESPLRAATRDDLSLIHRRLMEAIETSPYYSDEFKDYETKRLTRSYLEALLDADPWHIAIMQVKGETAGFMISGPELGTLWLYWSYVFPEKRKSAAILLAMRRFLLHWDHGRFHKVSTYTKPGNEAAIKIMERFDWRLTTVLQRHIFGEDYLLYEHPLVKTVPGYDHGAWHGRLAAIKRAFRRLLGR
jgi:RimJ/RimL family protein N-acetyltransferase